MKTKRTRRNENESITEEETIGSTIKAGRKDLCNSSGWKKYRKDNEDNYTAVTGRFE